MISTDEIRLIEVLVTHNEPVSGVDLACALGMTRPGVEKLAMRLQELGYAVINNESGTVTATATADAALDSLHRQV